MNPVELQEMATSHPALLGADVTQSNANSCQRVNIHNHTKASSPSSQILETIGESRYRTGSGGVRFIPSGQSSGSAAENEDISSGEPTNVEGEIQHRSEDKDGGIEEMGRGMYQMGSRSLRDRNDGVTKGTRRSRMVKKDKRDAYQTPAG